MYKEMSQKQYDLFFSLFDYPHIKRTIADGSIRTGKTEILSRSIFQYIRHLVLNDKTDSKGSNVCMFLGVTQSVIYDNAVDPLLTYVESKGYNIESLNTSLGKAVISLGPKEIILKWRGANDKKSFRRLQGDTYRCLMIDEFELIEIKNILTAEERMATFKDAKCVMTSNPEGGTGTEHYKMFFGYDKKDVTLHFNFQLLDNPTFTQENVDYYKKIFPPAMFDRKILGKRVKDTGGIYAKFSDFNKKRLDYNYCNSFFIGVDYGETDATTFVFSGIKTGLRGLHVYKEYCYKNNYTQDENGVIGQKDINEYQEDFYKFAEECYNLCKKPIIVYVDSAEKSFYTLLHKNMHKMKGKIIVKKVNKKKENAKSKTAIKERIDTTNIMIGADYLTVDPECTELIEALENAEYDDNGDRKDDGSFNNDILDAFEYSWKHLINKITTYIIKNKKVS